MVAAVARSCFHGHCIEHHRTRLALALDRKLSRLSVKKLQATTLAHANLTRQGPHTVHTTKKGKSNKPLFLLFLACLPACLLEGVRAPERTLAQGLPPVALFALLGVRARSSPYSRSRCIPVHHFGSPHSHMRPSTDPETSSTVCPVRNQ